MDGRARIAPRSTVAIVMAAQGEQDARRNRAYDANRDGAYRASDRGANSITATATIIATATVRDSRNLSPGYRRVRALVVVPPDSGTHGLSRNAGHALPGATYARGYSDGFEKGLDDGRDGDRYDAARHKDYRERTRATPDRTAEGRVQETTTAPGSARATKKAIAARAADAECVRDSGSPQRRIPIPETETAPLTQSAPFPYIENSSRRAGIVLGVRNTGSQHGTGFESPIPVPTFARDPREGCPP